MINTRSLSDQIDLAKIEALLSTAWLGRQNNEIWETIDSTNNRALELACNSAPHGTIVIAREQTAGRGRSDRQWFSPVGSGLYISFLVRPKIELANLPVITLVTGVAAAQAIQKSLNIRVGLKWVNDLLIGGRKIGGILCEYQNAITKIEPTKALIIGMGLNLHKPKIDLPKDLEKKIGFLESHLSADQHTIDPNNLIVSITNELEKSLEEIHAGNLQSLLDQWRAYSITLGEQIVAEVGDKQITGQALDITDSGELIVKTISGNTILSAGEVSIRKTNGYK
jgi:BirA family biotin operon repressor/biotin-[acetyl-CoA-carboxylase] ligase